MKHKLKIGVLLLSLFLLVGCDSVPQEIIDKLPDEITDVLPSVELVGEDVIQVVQYTEFTDPGAEVTGDFDLVINTVSDVDTSVLGEHFVTYSIEYKGITYSGVRTVMVILPGEVINFLGDELILVEKYTEFVDPGATVAVDESLELTVVSDVDTTVLGDYTITYSTTFMGVEYSYTRTVRVVDHIVLTDFEWVVETVSFNSDSISVHIYYDDIDGLLQNGKGNLYQGETLVQGYAINSGNNYLNFIDLDDNTDYKFVVEGNYDDDGTPVVLSGYELNFTTDIYTTMSVNTKNSSDTHNSISTEIMVTDVSNNITSIVAYLYLEDAIVSELVLNEGDTTFTVDGLLPDTEYDLKVAYTGPSNDDDTVVTIEVPLGTFLTDALPEPGFVLMLCDAYFTNIECALGANTTGLTDVILSVEAWAGGSLQTAMEATNFNTYANVTNLLPGTEYTLKFYAEYKISGSDEVMPSYLLHEQTITTKEIVTYATPTIENLVIEPVIGSTNSVTFNFDVVDPDDAIIGNVIFKLEPYVSSTGQLIDIGHNEIVITGYPIYDNLTYTFIVSTDYKVDEENSEYSEVIYEESFLTAPDVEGVSYTSNQSMYFHSERFIMILEIDNDDDLNIEYVTVNGIKIYKDDFLFPSNDHIIYLNMGVETDYTDYSYHITDFAVTMSDESSYAIDYDQTLSFRLQQPGDIEPDDSYVGVVEITTDDYTRLVTSGTDTTEVTIRLDNKYDLEVATITVCGEIYSVPDFKEGSTSKQIIIDVEIDRYFTNIYINGLVYVRNGVVLDSVDYNVETIKIYGYLPEDVVIIDSAAALNSINPEDNKYYYLTQDIDLTDFPIQPIGTHSTPFQGVFDGNGHTISNFTYTSLEVDQNSDVYLGLFGRSSAFLYDIRMTDSNITVNTNENHMIYVGTLVGKSNGTIIDCSTEIGNSITVNGVIEGAIGGLAGENAGFVRDTSAKTDIVIDGLSIDNGSSMNTMVGGLIGVAGSENIETSRADGTITISNTVYNTNIVGGLIGQFVNSTSAYATRNFITNSFASVDIYTSNFGVSSGSSVGGLVGTVNNNYATNTEIRNSYASGDIYSSNGYIGGLFSFQC